MLEMQNRVTATVRVTERSGVLGVVQIERSRARVKFIGGFMLYEFLSEHRLEIISRCRSKVAARLAPRPAESEMERGVPLFLDQLVETLRLRLAPSLTMDEQAMRNGNDLLRLGIMVAQVVHSYGDVCQAVTELAQELDYPISTDEFCRLNRSLDDAIADAVTEYQRQRDEFVADGTTERMGVFLHELRNLIHSASLAYEAVREGSVGIAGSTGAVLGRSLTGLRNLVNTSVADVRLERGSLNAEVLSLRDFIADVEAAAAIEARERGLEFSVRAVEPGITIAADREIMASVLANLLQNAFKFTKPHGSVSLNVRTKGERVMIDVEDQCGGLAAGTSEDIFKPFTQQGLDRSGLGLGLAVSLRGVEVDGGTLRVVDRPGTGCTFTIDMPKYQTQAA